MGTTNEMALVEKTKPDRPWAGLDVPVHTNSLAMFAISMVTSIGNGANTLLWSDHWLHGCSLEELAPEIHKSVPMRMRQRTVEQALCDRTWVADIRGALSMAGLTEYLQLRDALADITLPIR